MFKIIRKRLTYTNVALTLAILFAMCGGAYAAKKGWIITSTHQIKPSVIAALKGKPMPGPSGPQGAQGPVGSPGAQGAIGEKGANGAPGESVAIGEFAGVKGKCSEGGSKFAVGGKETFACNGKEGKQGPAGEPWPVGGLPAGATEKGVWSVVTVPVKFIEELAFGAISFTVPLLAALLETEHKVHVIPAFGKGEGPFEAGKEGPGAGCPTTSELSNPEAEPGNLCIFLHSLEANVGSITVFSPETGETEAAGKAGTLIRVHPKTAGERVVAMGTWAVTGQ